MNFVMSYKYVYFCISKAFHIMAEIHTDIDRMIMQAQYLLAMNQSPANTGMTDRERSAFPITLVRSLLILYLLAKLLLYIEARTILAGELIVPMNRG